MSSGLPFGSLTVTPTAVRLRSLTGATELKREEVCSIEFHKQRSPMMFRTFIVVRSIDGKAHQSMFVAWRTKAVRQALDALGWPTADRRVTARQALRLPRSD